MLSLYHTLCSRHLMSYVGPVHPAASGSRDGCRSSQMIEAHDQRVLAEGCG